MCNDKTDTNNADNDDGDDFKCLYLPIERVLCVCVSDYLFVCVGN